MSESRLIEPAPAGVTVAHVDDAGVYWGVIEKHAADVTETDVRVPADCDLAPGKYRLDDSRTRFVPLRSFERREAPEVPSVEAALYALIKAETAPPAAAAAWATWWERNSTQRG